MQTPPAEVERLVTEKVLPELLPAWLHDVGNRLTAIRLNLDTVRISSSSTREVADETLSAIVADIDRTADSASFLQQLITPRGNGDIAGVDDLVRHVTAMLQPPLRRRRSELRIDLESRSAAITALPRLALLMAAAVLVRNAAERVTVRLVLGSTGSSPDGLRIDGYVEGIAPEADREDGDGRIDDDLLAGLARCAGARWVAHSPSPGSPAWSILVAPPPVGNAPATGEDGEGRA